MSLAITELSDLEEPLGDDTVMNSHIEPSSLLKTLTFSKWLHSMLVRPFGQFIPQLIKMAYESLEIEDLVIDIDL